MNMRLRYDDQNTDLGQGRGLTKADRRAIQPKIKKAKVAVLTMVRRKEQGFFDLPFDRKHFNSCERVLSKLPKGITDLVVLGIGGSDLGGRMLLDAVGTGKGIRVRFGGSSTDPDAVHALFDGLNPKKTCVNIVSKSGGTIEPMASFLIAREMLRKSNGLKGMAQRIIATTDTRSGALHNLARKEGYACLEVPSNVGGRFSVLSSVGLFPALADGIDAAALLRGAKTMCRDFTEASDSECVVSSYVSNHVIALSKGATIHALMPYVARLKSFGQWYRQLFAESLGKKLDRKGAEVHKGLTPVAALGPEDQHSQLQLYGEGPFDKMVTFIEADGFTHDIKTPNIDMADDPIRGYGGHRFADIVHAERAATAESLKRQGRINDSIFINRLDAESLGSLIVFFEAAVAMMGEVLDVNAFDQPGVELSKQLMKEIIRR